jgi:hypothetical protein
MTGRDMDEFSQTGQDLRTADPRLKPTPDYGTLGPGSDIQTGGGDSRPRSSPARPLRGPIIAIALGGALAALVVGAKSARPSRLHIAGRLPSANPTAVSLARDFRQSDRMRPQQQAELLLRLAMANSDGATDQIFSRVDGWRGKLKWAELAPLFTAALNSKDLRVREAGIEVELAAYGLRKSPSSVDSLVVEAGSSNHAEKIWALWALGLMANRGIKADLVVETLISHLKDSDPDSRRWTVEALALVGADSTIVPLLQTMHDDPSPLVRERAACSLAESGMLTHEQRLTAVPQLLSYSDEPSLDAQTHAWAFQALHDITRQQLPNDPAAWRNWYQTTLPNGQ